MSWTGTDGGWLSSLANSGYSLEWGCAWSDYVVDFSLAKTRCDVMGIDMLIIYKGKLGR